MAAYPAHLHIDLEARARGRGLGRVLIEGLLTDLRARGVPGVHLGVDVANANAIAFYRHLGFRDVATEPGGLLMGLTLSSTSVPVARAAGPGPATGCRSA